MREEYERRKAEIEKRLSEFEAIGKSGNLDLVFPELCFCLLTPQSSAKKCDKAVKKIGLDGLKRWEARKIAGVLRSCGVRFHNTKAKNIVDAREIDLLDVVGIALRDSLGAREFLVKNVRGMGYKEAGHFLRNVGFGDGIAILDRHILKNMLKEGALEKLPKTIGRKQYMELEQEFLKFCGKKGIPPAHMDLLWWARETGEVFK